MNTINNRRPTFEQSRMCTECPPKPPKNTEEILEKSTKTIKKATKHKKSIGCFPALLTALAISGAVIGGIQYNNKQKNSAKFPIPATNVQNTEMKAEQQELKTRLNNINLNFIPYSEDQKTFQIFLNDTVNFRIANSTNIEAPILMRDIKEIDGENLDRIQINTNTFLRGVLTKAKKNPEEATKLATQIAYLVKNGSIKSTSKENWAILADFMIDPTRKPTQEEIKDMQDTYAIPWWKIGGLSALGIITSLLAISWYSEWNIPYDM